MLWEFECEFLQCVGLAIPLLISVISAYVGCGAFSAFMDMLGTPVQISGAYPAAALISLTNPLLIIFTVFLIPVSILTSNVHCKWTWK